MIGRYANSKYRELLRIKDFYRVLGGIFFIILSWLLGRGGYSLSAEILAFLALVLLGGPIILGALKGLLLERRFNVDELVSMAMIAAFLIGEYLTAAVVALVMILGSLMEEFTAQKAHSAINALLDLTPAKANVLREGKEVAVPVEELCLGERVIVRSGEKVPVDGRVIRGQASLNQSSLTGESLPVERTVGEQVFAGSVSYSGMIVVETQKVGADTSFGKMVKLVQDAESQKAPVLRLADRYTRYFTPAIVLISLLVYFFTSDISRAITVLIVGCPCAFILSAPTAIVSALGNASRKGILIKSGAFLEEIARITSLVFDKTGTLTTGKPLVTEIVSLNGAAREHVLEMAATAEKYSTHPLAAAILEAAAVQEIDLAEPEKSQNVPGKGVEALIGDKNIFVGGLESAAAGISLEPGVKVIDIKEDNLHIGQILIRDDIRFEVPAVINKLKRIGFAKIQMLTGDNRDVASYVAEKSGISDFYAELLPEDKVKHIQKLQREGYKIIMVGDGINDAPSLATADIGVAMGAIGTDAAIEAADVAIMNDDLNKLPELLQLAKATLKTINVNIIFAFIFNGLALAASGLGMLNPVWGAVVHNVGSVLVILNSSCLRSFEGKRNQSLQNTGEQYARQAVDC